MGRIRSLAIVAVTLSVVFLFGSIGQVWALTISPNPPIAGEPFTITNSSATSGDIISVYTGSGCANSNFIPGLGGSVGPSGSVSLTLSAGQYSAQGILAVNGCVNFTVSPAQSVPEYPYGLALVAVLMVLGYAVIKRKTRKLA